MKKNHLKIAIFLAIFFWFFCGGLPQAKAATEILSPTGAGSETSIPQPTPTGVHWSNVADSSDITYVYSLATSGYKRDLYAIADHSVGSGTINNVTVYARLKEGCGGVMVGVNAEISIKTEDTIYDTSALNPTGIWADYSFTWATNASTTNAWTWTEIDALEAGISLEGILGSCSILKGQPILMADGSSKKIEDVRVGDEIMSYSIDSKKIEKDKVINVTK